MKYTLALALVLAAVAAVCHSSAIKATPRSNVNVGFVATEDRLLYSVYVTRIAVADILQEEDVTFLGNSTTKISKVLAVEAGGTQYASAYIRSGGIGTNNVTIRFQTIIGSGYNYLMQIWGR